MAAAVNCAEVACHLQTMDFPALPARVRVIANDTGEPELVGLEGDLVKRDPDGQWVVFLDDDKMPTRFPPAELAVLGPDGCPERGWAEIEAGLRARLSELAC